MAPTLLSAACLLCVAVLLLLPERANGAARAAAKLGASSCFVLVALVSGALASRYGQWVLGALVLGWAGDALLLSRRPASFMAGLGAFLVAHLLYAAGFVVAGVSPGAGLLALPVALLFGGAVWRWLQPHVPGDFKAAVIAYVVVIMAMCATAAAHAQASGRWAVLLGAVLFAASDLAVARDRFVTPSSLNARWGLPTYFVAQLLLAWSVAAHGPAAR